MKVAICATVLTGILASHAKSPALRFYLQNRGNPWTQYFYVDWNRESTGSNYRLGYHPTFNISQSIYSFGRFSGEKDRASDIDRQLDASVGLGNNVYRTRNSRGTLEAGIGASQLSVNGLEDTTDSFMFAGAVFSSTLLDLFKLDLTGKYSSSDNYNKLDAEVGLSFRTGANTAIKSAYRIKRYDLEGLDDDIIDKDTFFTLTYGF